MNTHQFFNDITSSEIRLEALSAHKNRKTGCRSLDHCQVAFMDCSDQDPESVPEQILIKDSLLSIYNHCTWLRAHRYGYRGKGKHQAAYYSM